MIYTMTKIKDKVKYILEKYPHTREDDNKLIWQFIFFEAGGSDYLNNITGLDFLCELGNGKYTLPDKITRVRRKLQEDYIQLRGNNYQIRQKLNHEIKTKINAL